MFIFALCLQQQTCEQIWSSEMLNSISAIVTLKLGLQRMLSILYNQSFLILNVKPFRRKFVLVPFFSEQNFFSGPDTTVLARIKNELQKYHQENHGLIKIVRDSLNEYESKLTDLREALNEATGQIKQAENLNRDNGVLLEDIKVMSGFGRRKLNLGR